MDLAQAYTGDTVDEIESMLTPTQKDIKDAEKERKKRNWINPILGNLNN